MEFRREACPSVGFLRGISHFGRVIESLKKFEGQHDLSKL